MKLQYTTMINVKQLTTYIDMPICDISVLFVYFFFNPKRSTYQQMSGNKSTVGSLYLPDK